MPESLFDPSCLAGARVLDVSRPLDRCASYPGDPAYGRETVSGPGEPLVSRITLCAHSGTHLDAPGHVLPGSAPLADLPLSRFVLPALVVDVESEGSLVRAGALEHILEQALGIAPDKAVPSISASLLAGRAVLMRTANSANPRLARGEFDPGYAALDPGAARLLAELGAALVGIDGPGVDAFDAPGLSGHHILLGAGIPLLENLDLSGIEPGLYGLVCLPLALDPGAEAGPVRAALLAP